MCTEYSSGWDADVHTVVDTLGVPCQWSPAIHSRYHTGSTEAQAYLSLLNRLTSRRTFRCLLVLAPNYMTPFASPLAHCLGKSRRWTRNMDEAPVRLPVGSTQTAVRGTARLRNYLSPPPHSGTHLETLSRSHCSSSLHQSSKYPSNSIHDPKHNNQPSYHIAGHRFAATTT